MPTVHQMHGFNGSLGSFPQGPAVTVYRSRPRNLLLFLTRDR